MSNDLIVCDPAKDLRWFEFSEAKFIASISSNDTSLFSAASVCKVLELENVAATVSAVPEEYKRKVVLEGTTGTRRNRWFLTEAGVLDVVLRSRKPIAREFREWFVDTVLPTLKQARSIVPRSHAEMLLAQCQALVEQERRTAELSRRVEAVEANQGQGMPDHFTIVGWSKHRGLRLDLDTCREWGMAAASLSRAWGAPTGKFHHANYGAVNTYHVDVLREVERQMLNS